jgi:TPP-dependent pyruvate/acetoin dehydrogenase alpha subunit
MNRDSEFLLGLYQTMATIRHTEEMLAASIESGEVKCPCHLYSGQEAVAVGVCSALREEDYLFGNHRSHGHYLAKGGDLNKMVAEIFGKETGCSKGRGGSMHVIDHEVGVLGAVPIVGGTISLAVGAALSSKIRNDKKVTVCFFGDGSTGEGVLFEALNMASLYQLPIIFVCENNFYSTHMSILDCRKKDGIFDIASPFSMPTTQLDGNNILEVLDYAQDAVDHARNGLGPTFIEARTYRLRGHVGPDDNIQGTRTDIRPAHEILEWRAKDPLLQFSSYLIEQKAATSDNLNRIYNDALEQVELAFAFARTSPLPNREELSKYVFAI